MVVRTPPTPSLIPIDLRPTWLPLAFIWSPLRSFSRTGSAAAREVAAAVAAAALPLPPPTLRDRSRSSSPAVSAVLPEPGIVTKQHTVEGSGGGRGVPDPSQEDSSAATSSGEEVCSFSAAGRYLRRGALPGTGFRPVLMAVAPAGTINKCGAANRHSFLLH